MTVDLTGKACVITGATAGIGRATAHQLAAMGAELYIVSRSRERGQTAAAEITAATGNRHVNILVGDLARLSDVRRVAREFSERDRPLHLLLNNAGIMNTKRRLTIEGHEEMFAVNHLAHFLLTNLLADQLRAAAPSRVVTVASDAYKLSPGINFDDLNFAHGFRTLKVYGHSKLANILFSNELARRLEGTSVTSNALHPGAVSTQLAGQNGRVARLAQILLRPFLVSPRRGAATSLYASTAPELETVSGQYLSRQRVAALPFGVTDRPAATRLWEISATLTGLQ